MGASSQQGNTSGFRPYMGMNQGYGQQGGYQGFGQMPNMMANQVRQGFYGNPQYDMQMPWMQQFRQQGQYQPFMNSLQNAIGNQQAFRQQSMPNGTVSTTGGQLSFVDPMGVGVGNTAPQPSYNGGMTSTSGGQTSFVDPMGVGVQPTSGQQYNSTAGVDPATGRLTFY